MRNNKDIIIVQKIIGYCVQVREALDMFDNIVLIKRFLNDDNTSY